MSSKIDYEFAEDAGLGHMEADGFQWYGKTNETPIERIENKATRIANEIWDNETQIRVGQVTEGWNYVTTFQLIDRLPLRPVMDADRGKTAFAHAYSRGGMMTILADAKFETVDIISARFGGSILIRETRIGNMRIRTTHSDGYFVKVENA